MVIEKGIISDIVMGVNQDVSNSVPTRTGNDVNQSSGLNQLELLQKLFLGKYTDQLPWIHPGGLENALNQLIK